MTGNKKLIYFADPMCSWCWGFSPVITRVREEYKDILETELVMGGLRAGNTQVMDEGQREYILGHWHHVNKATGQPFDFAFKMPEGFIYDTEPSCRAVIAMGEHDPEKQFPFMEALGQAFYALNSDITDPGILAEIAAGFEVPGEDFESLFNSEEIRDKTVEGFTFTAGLGVSGFPTLLGKDGSGYVRLLTGYRNFEDLKPIIDAWLEEVEV